MVRYAVLLSLILLLLGGCSRNAEPDLSSELKPEPDPVKASALQFLDSSSFDNELSSHLRADLDSVTVTFVGDVSVNDIPERMDRWFEKLQNEEGVITMKVDPDSSNTKSIAITLAAITVAVTTYKFLRKRRLFSPVSEYDATIYYFSGQAIISRIVFTRKTSLEDL